MTDWAKLNAARDIVTYAHIHSADKLAKARAICDAADLADAETRGEYADESEALFRCADAFARAYITTALWTGVEYKHGDKRADADRDNDLNPDDIHPDTLRQMMGDCVAFHALADALINEAIETGEVVCGPDFDEWGRAGHDFWLTRNGHGAGFWDGDWPEPYGDKLTELAKRFGEFYLYTDDDGSVRGDAC